MNAKRFLFALSLTGSLLAQELPTQTTGAPEGRSKPPTPRAPVGATIPSDGSATAPTPTLAPPPLTPPPHAQPGLPATEATPLTRGILAEAGALDLDQAMRSYEAAVAEFDGKRAAAANTMYRLAAIYEKRSRHEEAKVLYGRILREFPDQADLARESHSRLLGAKAPPVRYQNRLQQIVARAPNPQRKLLERELELVDRKLAAQKALIEKGVASTDSLIPIEIERLQVESRIEALNQEEARRRDIVPPTPAPVPAPGASLPAQDAQATQQVVTTKTATLRDALASRIASKERQEQDLKSEIAALKSDLASVGPDHGGDRITFSGEAKKRILPFDAARPLWLYDAVIQAEYTEYASLSKVQVSRRNPTTGNMDRTVYNVDSMIKTGNRENDVQLQDGDIVSIPAKLFDFR